MSNLNMIAIPDIIAYVGGIPTGYDLVVYEKSGDAIDGTALYGFDEIGMFDFSYSEPTYCFLGTSLPDADPTYCHVNRPSLGEF